MNRLQIWECLQPDGGGHKFRIIESYVCVDGWRSRITNKGFETFQEAKNFIKENEL